MWNCIFKFNILKANLSKKIILKGKKKNLTNSRWIVQLAERTVQLLKPNSEEEQTKPFRDSVNMGPNPYPNPTRPTLIRQSHIHLCLVSLSLSHSHCACPFSTSYTDWFAYI